MYNHFYDIELQHISFVWQRLGFSLALLHSE